MSISLIIVPIKSIFFYILQYPNQASKVFRHAHKEEESCVSILRNTNSLIDYHLHVFEYIVTYFRGSWCAGISILLHLNAPKQRTNISLRHSVNTSIPCNRLQRDKVFISGNLLNLDALGNDWKEKVVPIRLHSQIPHVLCVMYMGEQGIWHSDGCLIGTHYTCITIDRAPPMPYDLLFSPTDTEYWRNSTYLPAIFVFLYSGVEIN